MPQLRVTSIQLSWREREVRIIVPGTSAQWLRLTNARILYRIPDFESVLQTYVWQDYDLGLDFPEMHKFLDFWKASLDGPLHSVRSATIA